MKRNRNFSNNKGFTLITLIITVILLIILSALIVSSLNDDELYETVTSAESQTNSKIDEQQIAVNQLNSTISEVNNITNTTFPDTASTHEGQPHSFLCAGGTTSTCTVCNGTGKVSSTHKLKGTTVSSTTASPTCAFCSNKTEYEVYDRADLL